MEVIIADDRPAWMIKEDKEMACLTRCPFYKKCSERMGLNCKSLGGKRYPMIFKKNRRTGNARNNKRKRQNSK